MINAPGTIPGLAISSVCRDIGIPIVSSQHGITMEICETNKNIDILVNNAGSIHTSIFLMNTIEKLREIFEVNFFSSAILTQIILKKWWKIKKDQ